jgi:hypothetical protein
MSLFNSLLEEISNRLKKNEFNKEEIINDINKITGLNLDINNIKIKENKLFFIVSPTIKTSIYLKKETLLKTISKYKITTIV